jgi:thymidylate synthase
MAHLIKQNNLSLAWLEALEYLNTCTKGKAINLSVVFNTSNLEDNRIRTVIDEVLIDHNDQNVNTIANTIFPQALYLPDKFGDKARSHLYEMSGKGYTYAKRMPANVYGRYIQRLIAYPGKDRTINQLEGTVLRLRREVESRNPFSSIYELGIADPADDMEIGADMRINRPDYDTRTRGFPCLSHISLTLVDKQIHMTALYRNQQFFRKAYGNYVGLSRLLAFFCRETGCEAGEIMCVATHADAELSRLQITAVINKCRFNALV